MVVLSEKVVVVVLVTVVRGEEVEVLVWVIVARTEASVTVKDRVAVEVTWKGRLAYGPGRKVFESHASR